MPKDTDKKIGEMSREELEQYARDLLERRSAEFEVDLSWGEMDDDTDKVKRDLKQAKNTIKLQIRKIGRQAEELEELKEQLKAQDDADELATKLHRAKLKIGDYERSLEGIRLAGQEQKDEIKEKNDQITELLKANGKLKEARNKVLGEAQILADLVKEQERWIEGAREKHARLMEFSEEQGNELVKYRRDVPGMKRRLERASRQLVYLKQVYQQYQVHGGAGIGTNFAQQVEFAKSVAKILKAAERQEVELAKQDEDESQSSQEFRSEDIEIPDGSPSDG